MKWSHFTSRVYYLCLLSYKMTLLDTPHTDFYVWIIQLLK